MLHLQASVADVDATCPGCGARSRRVHSRYERSLSEPAIGGQETVIRLRVRRFLCHNTECEKVTFVEQVAGVTTPYARRTPLQRRMLEMIALTLGGRPGHRLTRRLAVEASRSTLLRLVRALPVPEPGSVSVVGVDDFAFRRGRKYGSILVDMDNHQPIDMLPDRAGDTFAQWLRAHPGAETICRDRAGGYAEGARLGAPEAIQVADRWHLLKNLTEAVDKVVRAHRGCLRDQPAEAAVAQPAPAVPAVEGRRAELTRQRHAEVHALHQRGVGTGAICKALNLDGNTVRRYVRAATADELLIPSSRRGRELDAHLDYLIRRWEEGWTNAARLTEELRAIGYRGTERSVRRQLQEWRTTATPPSAIPPATPTPREVTGWIILPANKTTDKERADLTRILDRCDTLRNANKLVSDFAGMLREHRANHLDTWIANAKTSAITHIQGFAAGLLKDYDAVRNGIALHWSSGAVEGAVCRIKAIKRQMYGRANFDLLRRCVLLRI
nr:ISL3 family transposase [Fodinicola acaciae]